MYHFLDMTVVCADSCCPYVTVVNCEFCITWLCCVQMFCCPTVRQVNDQLCEPDAGLCRFLLLTNCTEQSHVSTIFVHILLLRFEEIICTNHSHVHNVWPFARLEVWLEVITTRILTTFERQNLPRPQSCAQLLAIYLLRGLDKQYAQRAVTCGCVHA